MKYRPRRFMVSVAAALAAAADKVLPGAKSEIASDLPEATMRELSLIPRLKLVTPIKPCPECHRPAEMEWREDGEAVRVGCGPCSISVEASVPPQSREIEGANRPVPLEGRQKAAQAEAIENWNLHSTGLWNARQAEVSRHYQTKIEPDYKAVNATPESDKLENKIRRKD